jgi:hypothetical protein
MNRDAQGADITSRLGEFKKKIKDTGSLAIDGIAKVAADLEMKELSRQLRLVKDEFQSDTFKLIVVGRQKNGKSTLMNVLLGEADGKVPVTPGGNGPMPTDELPATATLTRVSYSAEPYVRAWTFDGKKTDWTFAKYHAEAVLRDNERENLEFFKNIREFEVGYPAPLCKYTTLIDSPGTDEAPSRTAITTEAVRSCDASVVVYRHSPSPGEAERGWVEQNILGSGVKVFTVVNLWDGRVVDERLRAHIWDKLVRGLLGGEEYRGQDFSAQDIYFVDAKKAGQGKLANDDRMLGESGMVHFERRLGDFLLREREETHVTRFVRAARLHGDKVGEQISQRRSALVADRKKLEDAAEVIRPQFDAIDMRKNKLPKIIDRYRRESIRELMVDFEQMITRLCVDLPSILKDKPLKSIQSVTGTLKAHFTHAAVAKEASDICNDVIRQRIEAWGKNPPSKPGAQQILEPVIRRMIDEMVDEVATIQTEIQEIHFSLTGWAPSVSKDPKKDIAGRIVGIVGGILLGDLCLAAGGAAGMRGFAGAIGGYVAGALVVAALHLTFSVALPVVAIAGLLGGMGAARAGLEARIWAHTCQKADETLRELSETARPNVEAKTAETFTKLAEAIMKDVGSIITQEEENVRQVLMLNRQDQLSKNEALQKLDRAEGQLKENVSRLKNVVVLARQVGGQERVTAPVG